LLLTDMLMPGMGGNELAEEVTKARSETRVLFMSGYAPTSVTEHGILSGDIAFIWKPFTPDTLVQKVREVLSGPRIEVP